ncbi:MAG: indolepyruvate ferredoxin oxidoreductase family protein [Gammaproteobacteria bacterium]|nr:indolepyruvate ferredoxin oxidoreductase family protein [Gammaproteobacteria bacterium]
MNESTPSALAWSRYTSEPGSAYLTGIQALARLPIDQRRLDVVAGLDTAGFVSGYRGSPLGGLDRELWQQKPLLAEHGVVFQPGVNEDLAATAVWGTQQVGLFPGARHQGVFGLWYGKTPGLDRSMDAVRHGNAAGSSPYGGVLLAVGDDHGCKSSTMPGASEFALRDLNIPVLAPADVQDVLAYGLFGWALSRYAGCWASLIVVTDIADSAMSVDIDLEAFRFHQPNAERDVHIRLADSPLAQEERMARKLTLATEFARDNRIDRMVASPRAPRLAVVSAGKAYADVREALAGLGMASDRQIAEAGIRLAKVGMTWPLSPEFVGEVCRDADRVLVVEEKRSFLEDQMKSILFERTGVFGRPGARLIGKGAFPASGEISAAMIATAVSALFKAERIEPSRNGAAAGGKPAKELRMPLYCAGCPHSVSTRVPTGSRAIAGIGCHYMAQWMDRDTYTPTQMGGEGANWIGQAPFTDEDHVFVNLGDGTYFHSGILAIRAAVAAGVNVTYKLLVNDAVAMTGGQPMDGPLTLADMVAQVRAERVQAIKVVSDTPQQHRKLDVDVLPRAALDAAQRELRDTAGCTVLIYEQTCATELRRRRKRGSVQDPDVRLVINDAVCEGCGDCSVQSNCVAVAPLETEFGTKRGIDQSACNKDLSCLAGFCPSFVTVTGARPKRLSVDMDRVDALRRDLPAPAPAAEAANIVVAGIGGTGVVTVSQLLGTAAHLDGLFVSTLDMTGLAQKGGAVISHVRMSPADAPHSPTRIPAGAADLVIAADLVTLAGQDTRALLSPARTVAAVNTHVAPTAEFVLQQQNRPVKAATLMGVARSATSKLEALDAQALSLGLFGTATCANVLLLGFAYQHGTVPVSVSALERAIALNGVAVADNLAALHYGRAMAHDPARVPSSARGRRETMQPPRSGTLRDRIARRRAFLVRYQDEALAMRYEALLDRVLDAEAKVFPGSEVLAAAVADSAFSLYAVKDEYEVARLFTERAMGDHADFATKLASQFEPGFRIKYNLAPPFLAHLRDRSGRPRKIAVGGWMTPVLRVLAKMRRWRGTALDVFRALPERKLERELRMRFEADVATVVESLTVGNYEIAVALMRLPANVKGFGPVKEKAARVALENRERLLNELSNAARPVPAVVRRPQISIAETAD